MAEELLDIIYTLRFLHGTQFLNKDQKHSCTHTTF